MEQFKLRESDEFIKLGQVLKAAGLVENGVEAKEVIQNGLVAVNGEIDTRRGRKLYPGDTATFDGNEIKIENSWKTCKIAYESLSQGCYLAVVGQIWLSDL